MVHSPVSISTTKNIHRQPVKIIRKVRFESMPHFKEKIQDAITSRDESASVLAFLNSKNDSEAENCIQKVSKHPVQSKYQELHVSLYKRRGQTGPCILDWMVDGAVTVPCRILG
jgi:hypothetical protein